MERERRPIMGSPCGYRWPSEDNSDMHGCGLPPGHADPSNVRMWHWCTCGADKCEVFHG